MILLGEDSYSTGDQACEPPAKRDPYDHISKIDDHECMDHFEVTDVSRRTISVG
jgi:hypothetical protein